MLRTWVTRTHSRDFVFQQDGAPPHWSLQERALFNEEVSHRWIGRKSAQDSALCAWHPRSPDITPCDFYLWGYIKDNVYVPPLPTTLDDLRERITRVINSVYCDMLQSIWLWYAAKHLAGVLSPWCGPCCRWWSYWTFVRVNKITTPVKYRCL